jgi:hypothetical protein
VKSLRGKITYALVCMSVCGEGVPEPIRN